MMQMVSTLRGFAVVAALVGTAACVSETKPESAGATATVRGIAYAQGACASCHAVEMDETQSPNPAAPSFESLANRSDMTRMTLSALLRLPHRNMPNLIVAPEDIDDLSAYLSTLRASSDTI